MRRQAFSPLNVLLVLMLAVVAPNQAYGPSAMQAGQGRQAGAAQPTGSPDQPTRVPLDIFQIPEGLEITVWAAVAAAA